MKEFCEDSRFWVGWVWTEDMGELKLFTPWWITSASPRGKTVCAAIKAESKEDVKNIIFRAYDARPDDIEFRFIDRKHHDWEPFNKNFREKDWMYLYWSRPTYVHKPFDVASVTNACHQSFLATAR